MRHGSLRSKPGISVFGSALFIFTVSGPLVSQEPPPEAVLEATRLELGDVSVVSGPDPCDDQECYTIEVSCPSLAESEQARLKVGMPAREVAWRGTILMTTGGSGRALWQNSGPEALRVLGELRGAGFLTVQLAWNRGWLIGAEGELEGHARLACKPGSVARWIYEHFNVPPRADLGAADGESNDLAFCAIGNSGGSAQISYMVARYGLADILDAIVPSGGPPMGRIDLGCIRDDRRNERFWYNPGAQNLIDRGFGFPGDGSGPCAQSDASFIDRFRQASVVAPGGRYRYLNTPVWFLFGENDKTNAVPQGRVYFQRLARSATLLHLEELPKTGHAVHRSEIGVNRIRDVLLSECRVR